MINAPQLIDGDFVWTIIGGSKDKVLATTEKGLLFEITIQEVKALWRPRQWPELNQEFSPGSRCVVDQHGRFWGGRHAEFNVLVEDKWS
ncbi:MAG: hypothetical protein M2R45_02559 [Verrucomicrobia subdivision 3 bacterium]|nr:hypothetical protein [Limisphaerales bacterium]MCS1414234.1 hypothetical protein [Limisphaerales bacterium]